MCSSADEYLQMQERDWCSCVVLASFANVQLQLNA